MSEEGDDETLMWKAKRSDNKERIERCYDTERLGIGQLRCTFLTFAIRLLDVPEPMQ